MEKDFIVAIKWLIRSAVYGVCFIVPLLSSTGCGTKQLTDNEQEAVSLVKALTGRDILKDKWYAKPHDKEPKIIPSANDNYKANDFFCNLFVPSVLNVDKIEPTYINGETKNFNVHIFQHQLYKDETLRFLPQKNNSNLLDRIYASSLPNMENHYEGKEEREEEFLYYAIKCLIIPPMATNSFEVVENPNIKAYIFGKGEKEKIVCDVFLKDAKEMISIYLKPNKKEIMKNVYVFLANLDSSD